MLQMEAMEVIEMAEVTVLKMLWPLPLMLSMSMEAD